MINKKYNRYVYLYVVYTLFFAFVPLYFQRRLSVDEDVMRSAIVSVLMIFNVAFSFLVGLTDTLIGGFSVWANLMPSLSFIPIILLIYSHLPLFASSLLYCVLYSAAAFIGAWLSIPLKKPFIKYPEKRKKKKNSVNPFKKPF